MRNFNLNELGTTIALVSTLTLAGCATLAKPNTPPEQTMLEPDGQTYNVDPFESYNRKMFAFNNEVNQHVLEPINKAYTKTVPLPGRKGISNFFSNAGGISVVANDMLQNNWTWALQDTTRFVLNTTLGIFGIFDVASDVGLPARDQSFGLTFAKWGVTYSPYLILPVFGPNTVRGSVGLIPEYWAYPIGYVDPHYVREGAEALYFVQLTSLLLPKQQMINGLALDPYIAVRNAYLQNSDYLVQLVNAGTSTPNESD